MTREARIIVGTAFQAPGCQGELELDLNSQGNPVLQARKLRLRDLAKGHTANV